MSVIISNEADLLDLADGSIYGAHDILSDWDRDNATSREFFDSLTDDDRWTLLSGIRYAMASQQYTAQTVERNLATEREAWQKFLTIVGPIAKKAAADNRMCEEYENFFTAVKSATMWEYGKVVQMARDFAEACDRREKYTVTLTVLARNYDTAREIGYNFRDDNDAILDYEVERFSEPESEEVPDPEYF